MKLKEQFAKLCLWTAKNEPQILTGVGIGGFLATIILVAKAAPKAKKVYDELKESEEGANFKSTMKHVAPYYIPAAMAGAASIGCVLAGQHLQLKRTTAIAAAYKISESAYHEYKDKVKEKLGEKKEKEITDEIAKDKLVKNPVKNDNIIQTGKGDTLCYDAVCGRYFRSDIEKVRQGINNLNHKMNMESYISLNDFNDELGLERTKLGDMLGWNTDMGLIEPSFSSQLASNGEPCLVISYNIYPGYGYDTQGNY